MLTVIEKQKIWGNRPLYWVEGSPLYGYIGFGVIDRGTNVLQVRPTTICPLNCLFCSVDAGPKSRNRWAEFIVEPRSLFDAIKMMADYKGAGVEALIDTIGDAFTYPYLEELVSLLKSYPLIRSVAVETHGALLTVNRIRKLEKAGLDRINLSIDTLDPVKARYLQGTSWYDVKRVMSVAEYIVDNTNIDLHVTPVWIPGINDEDVIEIVKWAYRIGAGKKWPSVTIQKYNIHRYGRKIPGVRQLSWRDFWRKLRELESFIGLRVTWNMDEWGMFYARRYPCPYRRGKRIVVEAVSRGVFRGEFIGVSVDKPWLVTLIGARNIFPGDKYVVDIIGDKDCLLIGRVIGKV